MRKALFIGLMVAAATAGCSDTAGPAGGITPTIVALPAGAPPLFQDSASFYALKGKSHRWMPVSIGSAGCVCCGEKSLGLFTG